MPSANSNSKLAVLIDGDNADSNIIDRILNEAAKFGRVTIKRIYADFTITQMNGWKNQLNIYAIRPIQKFAYTKGKNSTDSALIIDAMDILHSKLVDGFCIVSSDSDYTGIAHRIREEGLFVMGIGKEHTPEAFVKACDNFTYTEILAPRIELLVEKEKALIQKQQTKKQPAGKVKQNPETKQPDVTVKHPDVMVSPSNHRPTKTTNKILLTNIITKKPIDLQIIDKAFEMVYDDITGLALASGLLPALKKVDPTFDIRSYGQTSFKKFIEALRPKYEIEVQGDGKTIAVKRGK